LPNLKGFGKWMNTAARVKHGILVGVVSSSGADQLSDQTRLSAEAAARYDYGSAFPTDDSGMDKNSSSRQLGHKQAQIGLQGIEHWLKVQ
jgi:hypothetical protein